jgi:hypothetical protein
MCITQIELAVIRQTQNSAPSLSPILPQVPSHSPQPEAIFGLVSGIDAGFSPRFIEIAGDWSFEWE